MHLHPSLKRRLMFDLAIIVASLAVALWLMRAGLIHQTLVAAQTWGLFGCFFAGLFFTSIFTVGPATVVLALLGQTLPPIVVALWGALGSATGDMVLFFFLRNRIIEDVSEVVDHTQFKETQSFFRLGFVRVLAPVLGALIIASPLPDELGLAMMGLSRTRFYVVAPIAFVMNFLGILAMVAAVRLW